MVPTNTTTEEYKAWRRDWQKARYKRLRDEWIAANGPCRACGGSNELQIDHIDRLLKERPIEWSRAKAVVNRELLKCQVLCKECHLKKTIAETPSKLIHGSPNMYRNGPCRCDRCREAHVAACRLSRERRKARTGFDR